MSGAIGQSKWYHVLGRLENNSVSVSDNQKRKIRVVGVTCHASRFNYYLAAYLLSSFFFIRMIKTLLRLENGPCGTLPEYVCVIVSAASIPYLGMVVRCLFKDVPVPRYRLGEDGQEMWFLAVMIFMYCISYNSKYGSRVEASLVSLDLILLGISLMQLSYPAGDFHLKHFVSTILVGLMFAILGAIGTISWSSFIVSLFFFPLSIVIAALINIGLRDRA